MISQSIIYFSILGASLGFVHTVLGPDHYIPFIFMAKARKWTMRKTSLITLFCGIGHVSSSIILGFIGIALGIGVSRLTHIESIRGNWAAWGFTLFGLIYMLWGIYRAYKKHPHAHVHVHGKIVHEHTHKHAHEHSLENLKDHDHNHEYEKPANITPWVLFVIFVLGPCEPLIPVVIYPAVEERGSISEALIVSAVFSVVTLATMQILVYLLAKGINSIRLQKLERYTHALAGGMLLISGIGILFLGL